MTEQLQNLTVPGLPGDVDMNNTEMGFDNLTILKEFGNIANLVRNEDFLETVPKAKLKRVKWVPMFNCLKQGILDEMVQEISTMWKEESMPQKLELLEKQREKYTDLGGDEHKWRPQLGDVKAQLRAHDVANLQKQKVLLESMAKEYEMRVDRLKKTLTAKRGYLKALQMDIQKYQKKNEEVISELHEKLGNRNINTKMLSPSKVNVDDLNWSDTGY